jgi:transcription-repair coupling factor (superfamily II helicase)
MRRLRDRYLDDARVLALDEAYRADRPLIVGACQGALPAVLIAALCARRRERNDLPPVIVTNDPATLRDDLDELGIVAAHLPELDRFAEEEGGDRAGLNRRMAALEAFAAGAALITDPAAAEQAVPDLVQVAKQSLVLKPGASHDMHKLVDRLVEAGYRVVPVVEGRGELAVRGGLMDVFPWIGQDPLRIEFFGDQIESIRRFDAFSQETIARADEAVLATASGGLATRDLWSQLPPGPLIVCADVALRGRLKKDHGRHEIRLARQLEASAEDGASVGVERLRGDLRHGFVELTRLLSEAAGEVLLLARNSESEKELAAHCRDASLNAATVVGRLSAGFRDLSSGLIVVNDYELMERAPTRRRSAKIAGGQPLSSLTDLKRNDHVVHLHHGIGIFRGMATLEKRGFLEDFLLLEFAEGTKLYVPVDAIDLVQKYIGATGKDPALSKIGGQSWAKQRAKAEKAIQDMSGELLQGQAARLAAGGIVYPADTADQRQFEARFPYEETEDQLAAVREIKADMEKPVAMDRLLCGDVGFGKTEVAMRAAMKAVQGGKQVAMLAPTTLLAEQHVETFTERFAGTPVRIAGMTRFNNTAERKEALDGAAAGTVDILIGTHAILTDKLSFANLGLLIVDEEHRFGVKQKEKLKSLVHIPASAKAPAGVDLPTPAASAVVRRSTTPCDVLTLSATPIPRTLHFSLLGLRDISVLAEAPSERLAVETRVCPWEDELIRHALQRELERQGQIFVVTHRVQDLDPLAYRLSKLAPGIRLDSLHGQMEEHRIARVMDAFRTRQLDCIVSTSIIESGIDVPNANTLLVNNAHHFGLAELHQIRGRIGRFTRQAFAYFITPPGRELSEESRERLNAIQEYAELGAGFKLAMRDLELRGAGNLLGGEQSGQIDAIGYELYTKLLGEAVARAKNIAEAAHAAVTAPVKPAVGGKAGSVANARAKATAAGESILSLPIDAYIPDDYLETPALKFELHKQLDSCRKVSDLEHIARTTRDRFGALVDPVARLFRMRAIRIRSQELAISRIDVQDRQLRLHLSGAIPKDLAAVKVPELVHLQLDGSVLVLFLRAAPNPDLALDLLCRLMGLDMGFLGRGF